MRIEDIRFLYKYNYWARNQMLDAVAQINLEQFTEIRPYGHGSIRNTLVHILSAEWLWRVRCQELVSPDHFLLFTDFPTPDSVNQAWQLEQKKMENFLDGLVSKDLDSIVEYKRTSGETRENILWHLLIHVVNHGTEHRSNLALELTTCGVSPGDLDIIHFLRADNGKQNDIH